MPEISVIVPVYNVEKYLNRCIDSILNQSFPDFELILIDDGSTDNSGVICDKYAEKDNRVFVIHQKNAGQASARNVGLRKVFATDKTQWIAFIDSDDWISNNYFKALLNAVKENSATISLCGITRIAEDGTSEQSSSFSWKIVSPEELYITDVTTANSPCGKLFHKELLRNVQFPDGKTQEDLFLIYRIIFLFSELLYVPTVVYYYYINPTGTTGKPWTHARLSAVEALTEQCLYFRKNHFTEAEKVAAYGLFHELLYALCSLTERFPEEKKRIRQLRRKLKRVYLKYRKSFMLSNGNGKKTYEKTAHPFFYRIRKKWKHLLVMIK